MHTIVLATQKGGSGKTTLAIGLALAATEAGHTVRLVETDSQGTLSNWQRRRAGSEPLVEAIHVADRIEQRLQSLCESGVTLTIIDTAGGLAAATTAAIRYSDLCLIPARPSIADIEATASTVQTARAWNTPFAFVLNQTPIRGQRLTGAATALCDAASIADVVAQPFVVTRNDHQDALSAGLAVGEYAPFGKSADEIRGLWQWVAAKLGEHATADEPEVADETLEAASAMFMRTPAATIAVAPAA
ncbi:MAG: AAA family ATPase [Bradyrhizobium sp.]